MEEIEARAGGVKIRINGTEKTLTLALAGIEPAALPTTTRDNEIEPSSKWPVGRSFDRGRVTSI